MLLDCHFGNLSHERGRFKGVATAAEETFAFQLDLGSRNQMIYYARILTLI